MPSRHPPPPSALRPPEPVEALGEAITQASTWLREGRWLTWDAVDHGSRAAGLRPESVWWCTKMLRESQLHPTGLDDIRGRPFRWATSLVSLQAGLREVDLSLGGNVTGAHEIAGADRDQVVIRALTEEAFRSSEIEGAVTTRKRAQAIIASGDLPRDSSERMVLNNYRALRYVRERRAEPITLAHLLALHAILVEGTLPEGDAGRLRTDDDDIHVVDAARNVVVHTPPPAALLPARLERLLAFANAPSEPSAGLPAAPWVHPALRAIAVHFLFGWEHPFVDGNGRCARALWYWVMLRNGYWMAEFIAISEAIGARRAAYYQAFVDTEQDDNDLTYFLVMHLDAVTDAIARLRQRLERQRTRLRSLQRELGALPLNHRQKALLAHALRHPGERYRFDTHAHHHDVAYGTARSDLMELAARGLLPETREGRTRVFVAPADLAQRIAALRGGEG